MNNESSVAPDKDYSSFFLDPGFAAKYPDVKLPPPTHLAHEGKILSFQSGKSITIRYPVREFQTNPVGTLQGGILSSFIDDAFGCLCFATMRKPCISIDMTVNFIRPVRPDAFVIVRAEFKAKGRKLLQVSAEAFTGNEKLVATATSNLMAVEQY